jgi:DNA-directed RNA polymerase III subunit RPC4
MSNRLESLNSKKSTPSSKPSLKFKPKVVARKTKEERAKDAPIVKQEDPARNGSTRGRGSMRGGRGRGGRNNYAGTHLVSSGPLSSGSVSIGNVNGSKLGLTADRTFNSVTPTPEFLQNLKQKERPQTKSKSPTPGYESEEEDDPTKINMTQEYTFDEEETVLFPFRPSRIDVIPESTMPQTKSETQSRESSPEELASTTLSEEITIKSEPLEEKLEKIKAVKAELETKITETSDQLDKEEASKLIVDHQEILDLLTQFDGLSTESDSDKYIALHLPKVLPNYGDFPVESEKNSLAGEIAQLKGQVGLLNIHQSGKITINLGNDNNLSVARGNPSNFLQELVVIDMHEKKDPEEDYNVMDEDGRKIKGDFIRLGKVYSKIVATPIIN